MNSSCMWFLGTLIRIELGLSPYKDSVRNYCQNKILSWSSKHCLENTTPQIHNYKLISSTNLRNTLNIKSACTMSYKRSGINTIKFIFLIQKKLSHSLTETKSLNLYPQILTTSWDPVEKFSKMIKLTESLEYWVKPKTHFNQEFYLTIDSLNIFILSEGAFMSGMLKDLWKSKICKESTFPGKFYHSKKL